MTDSSPANERGWFNFHTHSRYCDGKGTPAEVAAKARSLGMKSLGFSSHAPVPFDCKWCMSTDNLDAYLAEIDELKNESHGLDIYKSLEIDFIPGKISPADFRERLDYTIGSIHFVDAFADGRPWEIDGAHIPFLEGLASVFKNDMRAAVTRYLELTREMIRDSSPTIVGHLDKIKIQNQDNKFFQESDHWYQSEIIKTLDLIAATDCIVEINTRGIYQKKSATTYPSPWIIDLMKDRNIPMTISSDAHVKEDLTNQFSETASLLVKSGVETVSVLHRGVWQKFDYNEHGIIA